MASGPVGGLMAPGPPIIYNINGNKVACASAAVAFTQFSGRLTSHAFLSTHISAIYTAPERCFRLQEVLQFLWFSGP